MTDEEIVNTPAGPVPRSKIQKVDSGTTIRRTSDGRYLLVKDGEGGGSRNLTIPEGYVITPGGMRPKSLVHHIELGSILDATEGRHRVLSSTSEVVADFGLIAHRPTGHRLMPRDVNYPPKRVPAFGSGWITFGSWANNTGNPISLFSTRWVVPPEPTSRSGQLIYIFPGIQNSTMIYQPVLQWGSNGLFGGDYWCVASWYADGQGGQAFHTDPVQVNAGDVLIGVMTLTGQSPQGFSYSCVFQGIAGTNLPIQNVEQLTWCAETLECYGITKCSDYPNTNKTLMGSINIQTGNVHPAVVWESDNWVTDCGQHTLIFDDDSSSNGEVDLWYSPSPFWTAGMATIGPGQEQEWWFAWGGNGDVGPQLIQAEPLNGGSELMTTKIGEIMDGNGYTSYRAIVHNTGPNTVHFQWRGGGR